MKRIQEHSWAYRLVAVVAIATVGLTTAVREGGADQQEGFRVDSTRGPVDLVLLDPVLRDAIDIHMHLVPDSPGTGGNVRGIDAFEMAKLARARGMRGFVYKTQHDASSAAVAYLVREHAVPGLEVFGMMALNLAAGGINVAAVERFSQIHGGWGRIVMMPTTDTDRERDVAPDAVPLRRPWIPLMPPEAPRVVSTVRDGELVPEVTHLIGVMAKLRTIDSQGPLVLATGHASPEEHLLLAREGRRLGLQVVLTHGSGIPLPEQQEAAKLGAFIEFTINGLVRRGVNEAREAAERIRQVGAESYIVASDCGQMSNPLPTDCLAMAARALRAQGITERELNLMFKENPARLLGLSPPPSR